jgi:hypothetical protein
MGAGQAAVSASAINFSAHQTRSGLSGAREDFEQMLALLVQAGEPSARLIAANPGDWGIDVVVGELDGGDVTVFQAKYFYPIVETGHQQQIRESFKAALAAAAEHGHRVARWTLCVPASMDGPTARWWDGWKKRTAAAHGVSIDLWDETALRRELLDPRAVHVREHYYGRNVSEPIAPGPTEQEVAEYQRSLSGYVRAQLHPYVPLAMIQGDGSAVPGSLHEVLRYREHINLVAPSGAGKTHALSHCVADCGPGGWVPVFIRGGFYTGDLSRLMDAAVAPHSSFASMDLIRAAVAYGLRALLVVDGIDGYDGCDQRLRARLIEDVAALTLRSDVSVVLSSQAQLRVPETLRTRLVRIEAPGDGEREALRASYGGPENPNLYTPFATAYEISLAAMLAARLPHPATSAHLFDAFIRDRTRGHRYPTATRAVLRRLALAMDEGLTGSLSLADVDRCGEEALGGGQAPLTVLDDVLGSSVVRVEDGRLMFAHEQLARFLIAEEIVRTRRGTAELARELARPRHGDLAPLAVPLESSPERLRTLLQALDTQNFADCLHGRLGPEAEHESMREARRVLAREAAALCEVGVGVGPGHLELRITGARPRSDYEETVIEAVGQALKNGLLVDEVLELLDATEAACARGTDQRPALERDSGIVVSAITGYGQRLRGLAAATALKACEMEFIHRYDYVAPDTLAHLRRLTDQIEARPRSHQYLACLVLQACGIPEAARLALPTAQACWNSGEYHLQLAALELVKRVRWVAEPASEQALGAWLDALATPKHIFLSTALVEALDTYGLINTETTVEDVADHITRVLQAPHDAEARAWANYIVASQFEDVVCRPYTEAVDALSPSDFVALLSMAAMANEDSFFTDWTLQHLIDADDPGALEAFVYWSERLDPTAPFRQSQVHCHTLGVQGRARFAQDPPRLAGHPGRDGEAWQCYDAIIHWMHRPGLTASEVRERCAPHWDALTGSLAGAAVDPLYNLRQAIIGATRPEAAAYPKILQLFPSEVATVLEFGLTHPDALSSLFSSPRAGDHPYLTEYLVTALGEVGGASALELLSAYTEDPALGAAAVSAIRKLRRAARRTGTG